MRFQIPWLMVAMLLASSSVGEEPVDFSRDVLPILSNKCFVCHGPDGSEDTDLRLDLPKKAFEDRGGYRVVDQQHPDQSELLHRIDSDDEPMPPVGAQKQLTESEKQKLRRWVAAGGKYSQHWAFVRPEKRIDDGDRNGNEIIDHYISHQQNQQNIQFAPAADRAVLARRAALTLTGLPLEPEKLQQYMDDKSDGAYQRLIDRLLDSPRFGEHQARYWLDAVRYGDTHGLHLDNRRGIYPYRDWVVRSINNNLPIDQFITWQIAGDLLPSATLEQRVATGYVRLNPSTGEGGAIPAEFQAKNNFDRVENLGTVFLGMSLTCARCHNHKYDPISQTEYYRLLAFFNSTAEPAMDGNSYTYGPTVQVPSDQSSWQQWQSFTSDRSELLRVADQSVTSDSKLYESIVHFAKSRQGWKTSGWQHSVIAKQNAAVPTRWSNLSGLPGSLSGRSARGKLPAAGQSIWIALDVSVPQTQHLQISLGGANGSALFRADSASPLFVKQSDAPVAVPFSKGTHRLRIKLIGASNELRVGVEHPWDALAKAGRWEQCSDDQKLAMLADPHGPLADLGLAEKSRAIYAQGKPLKATFTTSLVAQELPSPRETRLLRRGEYNLPQGDPLEPGVLSVMGSLPEGAARNRLGLANWLVSPEHPLTSRVLINRVWGAIFGEALVRTPEDFGLQGEQPTHPELLDWLAAEFQESGWDLKHMIRMMVLSQTFRQSSAWRPDVPDPQNRLFARGPSYRLDAEVLRDMGLWASELLDPHMGGEGVKPYQPPGMWLALAHPASNTKSYQRDSGKRLYRRSLYVYWKRTSPHPMMTLFDAPDREISCVARSRTNTSLQSLGLFNETQRTEMARMLAQRLLREHSDTAQRLNLLFRLVASRAPTEKEKQVSSSLVRSLQARYEKAPQDAVALLSIGEVARNEELDPAEHAAWAQLAAAILASDLAIMLY